MSLRSKLEKSLFTIALMTAMPLWAAPPRVWTTSWGASQLVPTGSDVLPKDEMNGATLTQVVHLSVGGKAVRLHLSNAFGESPLVLRSVKVARTQTGTPGAVEPLSQLPVLFSGNDMVSIPAGAEYLSDPIEWNVASLSNLSISMAIDQAPESITFHAGSRATSFLLKSGHPGNQELTGAQALLHWYFIAGVEVAAAPKSCSVVVLGDSITDGHGATNDANDRWTDVLADRVAVDGVGIVNEGIGGNRILQDGLGPNALARFDRDVLAVAGVRYLIVLEGINDLGVLDRLEEHGEAAHAALVEQLKAAYRQMVERAHAHGIRVYGATLTPDGGSGYYHPGPRSESDRRDLNQWIRTSGTFDDVIDFDKVLRDPLHPDRLAQAMDSGDHLHPGPAGYRRMGESVPLGLFRNHSNQ